MIWGSDQNGSGNDLFGQRYDASGMAQGTEFRVNSYTTGDQRGQVSVAFNTAGAFVVVWTSVDQDGSGAGAFGQGFDPAGNRLGDEFRINSYTTGSQAVLAAVSDGSGGFVVLWGGPAQDGNGVFGRRYDASGTPQALEFLAIPSTTGGVGLVSVAADASGDFVVVWNDSSGRDGSGAGVFAQRFAQDLIFKDGFESDPAILSSSR